MPTSIQSCLGFLLTSIATLNITNTECGVPVRDMTGPSIIVPSVGYIVLLFIASRIYTRLVMVPGFKLGWDDWAIIALAALMVAVNAGSILRRHPRR